MWPMMSRLKYGIIPELEKQIANLDLAEQEEQNR